MIQTNTPAAAHERVQSLDILRGIAILGILIMNIQSYAMTGAAYLNPTAYGSLDGLHYWVWIFSHIFADQKFITLFSILFGAGILLVSHRMEAKSASPVKFHLQRNFWLLVIGLIHAYVIWYGDILVTYALCSFLVFWLRNKTPRTLCVLGGILLTIPTLLNLLFSATIPYWPQDTINELQPSWQPSAELIAAEIAALTGSLREQISYNANAAVQMQTLVFFTLFLWRVSGLMLIGMALYKWGILSASRSIAFYKKGMSISFVIGFPIIIFGIIQNFNAGWSISYSMFTGTIFNYWGSLAVSFGYLCAIMIFVKSNAAPQLKVRFAAVGRMALTNYIAQSVIAVFIFYGVGLGLFGHVDRALQLAITIGIWLLQLAWSKPWLDSFAFGPLEWAWRSLTYRKSQPLRKAP